MSNGDQEKHARNMARASELDARKARIRALNDQFRKTGYGGRWMITPGIRALGIQVPAVLMAVREFDSFSEANDPHEEHDFGSIEHAGQRIFWKIDCYDKALECGSPDPTDPDVTARVITIMLASEY